ncbi:glycerophosphodiester phosphodiesterase domain-containing protein 5-like isoform X1 [Paramormyrops kingsleyae]|uniref:glycerophosphodiester phosphodiesterase domain-containing protein 5-like isoform X1 n=1 Tax=Paramormyrops kingsleyae TaxID=1676925 RepID=UPI003B9789C4
MVKHQPLQVYERQLCLSCLTGIYGCRWQRYQRSHDDSTKWERLWFFILCAIFLLLLVWTYFWWATQNDYSELNWLLYNRSGEWTDGTVTIVAATATGFTYVTFLMILAVCHMPVGQQLHLYWLHKVMLTAVFLTTVVGFVYISGVWGDEWKTVLISLQVMGPVLQLGALTVITLLAWVVAGQVARAESMNSQVALALTYLAVLLAIYLAPLSISSPCLKGRGNFTTRPAVLGRRGAPMLAPENTLMSFRKALEQKVSGLEADVAISLDGVPFLMRAGSLRRTTDVQKVFPKRQWEDPSSFRWAELSALNAGRWFVRDDPFWTVRSMTPQEISWAANQTVCSLAELLASVVQSNTSVLLRLQRPPPGHPRHLTWLNDTLQTVLRSGVLQKQVLWTPDWERDMVRRVASGLQQTSEEKLPVDALHERGLLRVYLRYDRLSATEIRELSSHNVSVTLFTVNVPWLYSALWCSGVSSVSSDAPHILKNVPSPIWLVSPDKYCLVWITSDLISFAIVITVFTFQRWRMSGMHRYNPEQIMLSAAVRRSSREVSLMKEKLIFAEIDNGMGATEGLSLYTENGYDCYTNEGVSR